MRISELAGATGVPATTLRFYEVQGLLPAVRTPGNYRDYDAAAIDRLSFIGTAQGLGLRLEEIRELLVVWDGGACRDVRVQLRPRLRARMDQAAARQDELDAFVTHLYRALQHLDSLPDRDTACDASCSFLTTSDRATAQAVATRPAVACSLTGSAARTRFQAWHSLLRDHPRQLVPGGWRVRLPLAEVHTLVDLALGEQECCPFLSFTMTFDAAEVHLTATAAAEGQTTLQALLPGDGPS